MKGNLPLAEARGSFHITVKRGFTLIELLVVIGVLAVISSGVVALIDPTDKLKQANEAKIQNDLGQVATAVQAYYLQGNGYPVGNYAAASASLVSTGELVAAPIAPTNSAYYYENNAGSVKILFQLLSKKYSNQCVAPQATPYWVWCSTTGLIGMDCGNAALVAGGNYASVVCP